jgi:protein-L-isoaspartate(D-aspartate) O-methyltransferase
MIGLRASPGQRAALLPVSCSLLCLFAVMASACSQAVESEEVYAARRREMVAMQIEARGVKNPAVLEAMRRVPRHRFVPESSRGFAYFDIPLSIGRQQTISQPYMVGLMTSLVRPAKEKRVLEIGTGSGYQAAVLSECFGEVDTIEVIPELGLKAKAILADLGCRNVNVKVGDGYAGWPEKAPFDAILLTAAPPKRIPQPLLDQLRVGGVLVAPVGRVEQDLVTIVRTPTGFERAVVAPVRFVPMTGKAEADR